MGGSGPMAEDLPGPSIPGRSDRPILDENYRWQANDPVATNVVSSEVVGQRFELMPIDLRTWRAQI